MIDITDMIGTGSVVQLVDTDGGSREKKIAQKLRDAAASGNFENAYAREMYIGDLALLNLNSGYVWLAAGEEGYEALRLNGNNLDVHINLPGSGHEGFYEELVQDLMKDLIGHYDDLEHLLYIAKINGDLDTAEHIEGLM